jgi:hypothetical protein
MLFRYKMSPSQWGPPTWLFLHTLAEKVKEESFPIIGRQIIVNIIQICNLLPCPECANHAKEFWKNVSINNVSTKTDLKNLLYVFHNSINKRKKMPAYKHTDLEYYSKISIVNSFNWFTRNFNTKGNMNLINESFHRGRFLTGLKHWFMLNINHFNV